MNCGHLLGASVTQGARDKRVTLAEAQTFSKSRSKRASLIDQTAHRADKSRHITKVVCRAPVGSGDDGLWVEPKP